MKKMEGGAVSATVGVLVQNLIFVSGDEISKIRGLEKDADKLKGNLVKIRSSLDDAQKKFITDDAVKRWLKELEATAYDADNVLDEVDYEGISKQLKTKKEVSSRIPSFVEDFRRQPMTLKIKEINTTFESINTRANQLGLEREHADAPAAPDIAADETESFIADPIFIGRDHDVSVIVEVLTTPRENDVSIFPIVGMGGVGKTTLAQNVFHHEKIVSYFGQQIWVHVSENFDTLLLLKKILVSLRGGIVRYESREVLLKKLREALGAKTYMLVLDDVWNEDRQKWLDFMDLWSGITSTRGNCIIVTTRSTKVGSIVNTHGIYHLNGLSDEECWSIIKDRAFNGGDVPVRIEAIRRSIARRCQGLPSTANLVGGLLRSKSQDEWLLIKENWHSYLGRDEDAWFTILRLSYDHLSSPSLKKCFAYCSVFPKGTHMERIELIQLWMAEGFLIPSPIIDMENVGKKIVELLVQRSLLQVVDRDEFNNHY